MNAQTNGVLVLVILVFGGCNQSDFPDPFAPPIDPGGPGSPAWGEEDVSCTTDGDCAAGETCFDGVCQMARCNDGPYSSTAPLAAGMYFFNDQEILVADAATYQGTYWVDGYAPLGSSADYSGSWDMGGAAIIDVAGGDLLGSRPHVFAVATAQSTLVTIGGTNTTLNVGFQPVALGTGDVDRDHRDELIVLGAAGDIALCDVDEGTCDGYEIPDVEGMDVTVADVDGDKFAEPVFLLEVGGDRYLYVWNSDAELTGHNDFGVFPNRGLIAIDAGDLNGDGLAEVVGLEDDGWIPWDDAQLYTFSIAGETIAETASHGVAAASRDVSLADLDMDRVDEVLVLRSGSIVEVLRGGGGGQLVSDYTGNLVVSGDPDRISASDFDGDSPAGVLAEGPQLIAGRVVPTMLLHFPPYDRDRSADPSYLFIGQSEVTEEELRDSVSLSLGVDVGVSAGLAGVFMAELSVGIREEVTTSILNRTNMVVGDRFFIEADPDLYGADYGAVVLSCGCFHGYTYRLEDPAGKLGADGERFVVMIPVAGQTTLWSSKRYNAMASAVGDLPIVAVPNRVGDPTSYPSAPALPGGAPIPANDLVFSNAPTYLVSDVGFVGWWLSVTESETNEVSLDTTIEMNSSVNLAGFQFGSHLGAGWGRGYAITIGTEALFGGGVPPIPDDPSTPEDEYTAYSYSFSPIVYRRRYVDASGNELAYYSLTFTVGL